MRRLHNGRENECSRDEGYVHCDKSGRFDLLFAKIASVGALQKAYARIRAQAGGDLPVTGVDCDHPGGAMLQKTVGEAAGGSADIHADFLFYINVPMMQ